MDIRQIQCVDFRLITGVKDDVSGFGCFFRRCQRIRSIKNIPNIFAASDINLFLDYRGVMFPPLENAVRKTYSKTPWLLYEIRIFERKYVNRTVIKVIYCMFYVRESCPAVLSALLFT